MMDTRAMMMGLAFVAMWASAFTSGKIAVAYAPPFLILAVRFFVSGLFGVGLAYLMGQRLRMTRAQWIATVVFGMCQNTLYLGLNFVAFQSIDASIAVIIASALPISVALFSFLFLRERLPRLGLFGMVLGSVGVLVVMGDRLAAGADPFGVALCVVALLALTVATMIVRSATPSGNVLMVVGLQMLVGAVTLLPLSLLFETWVVDWTWQLVAAFTYTTIFPGLVATVIWFFLVQRIGATRAATFHFLNPFLGVAIAAALLGEALNVTDLVGVGVIMVGIFAVQFAKSKPVPPASD
ncbi:MAG: DMT family transporter [Pseudomonadota bacterium]